MNNKFSNITPRRVTTTIAATVAAVVLSTSLATSAYAMPRDGDGGQRGDKSGYSMMHGTKGMTRLHDNLKLDAAQETLWQNAVQANKDERTAMRDKARQQRDEIKAMLDKPGADLRAVAKRMDEVQAEGQKMRMASRDRWLTVYDSLNAEQKEQAREFFKNQVERKGHRGHDRRGK